ncbi:MAG: DNA repair protein RecN [Pseudobdellovibrionaceae bacterium]
MLLSLQIRNVVLIDLLNLDFAGGLCALTGETGAGKSILLDSLGLAMGARSEARLVRKGTDAAQVTAVFSPPKSETLNALLSENGIAVDAGEDLILRRQVASDGRSKAWVNDQTVSISLLKDIGDALVEYHGQFETHGLLNPKTHGGLLDEYAGLATELASLKTLWGNWAQARDAYHAAVQAAEKAREEEDYIRASLDDLTALDPQDGEEETLEETRVLLKNREQILGGLQEALQALTAESGAEALTVQAARRLERIADKTGEKGGALVAHLDRAIEALRDAGAGIEDMAHEFDAGGKSLEEIEDRLYALRGQARKHHCLISDLPEKMAQFAKELTLITDSEAQLGALEKAVREAREAYVAKAKSIAETRKNAASKLDQLVMSELVPLKLERARFETEVSDLPEDQWGENGTTRTQFLVATNPGAEAGPLHKIASGGEMARFMLALKVVLAEVGSATTLVFDEVDTGIGGATADAVGQRLARLASYKQILVVTHSPQVAAAASHHFIVAKGGETELTTKVIALENQDARREEIARMLAGAEITAEARAAASSLLNAGKAA